MVSADVKANKNNKNKRSGGFIFHTNFYKKYLQKLRYNVKRACIFHLILVGILYPS